VALALSASVATSAGAHSFDQPDRVLVSTSGNGSELVKSVSIGTAPGAETVVMSLPPKGQPFQSGDGLSSGSELEVTTDCSPPGGDQCVGTPYSYDPSVDSRLILTSGDDPTGSSGTAVELAGETGRRCTHEQHHCVLVFSYPSSPFAVPSALPCALAADGCRLNLLLDAYSPDAQPGNVLIVGENEPGCCGITAQDKGRVNAVRLRPVVPGKEPAGQVKTYSTSTPLVNAVPVRDTVSDSRTVVFSQRLGTLSRNEQLAVSANMSTDMASLPFNRALIQSRLILADSRGATAPSADVKAVEELKGELSEANGFNCTQDTNPCETRKVGVAHLIHSSDSSLYVNLVVSATPAKSGIAQPGQTVSVTGGALKVVRYPASRYG